MLIQYSPVVGEEKIEYKFNGEKIQVGNLIYDLSTIEADKRYIFPHPLMDVYRGEELEVTLIQYHQAGASEEERYPKPFKAEDSELDSNLEVKQLEEIKEEPEHHEPSEVELLQIKLEEQSKHNAMMEQALMEMAMEVYK